jgi:hypothetical protein
LSLLLALVPLLSGGGGGALLWWSGSAVLWSLIFWVIFTARMGAPFYYGLLYPLGASVGMHIFLRSWRRGRNVEWKGRTYVVKDVARLP